MKVRQYGITQLLMSVLLVSIVTPIDAKAPVRIKLPPSAELRYTVNAKQSGFNLNGNTTVVWFQHGKTYRVSAETQAQILGNVLETSSEGTVNSAGLVPNQYREKSLRKAAATATFDHANKTIRFTQSDNRYPMTKGVQDRASIIWQLAAMARANPKKMATGTQWHFMVVGPRDQDPWHFTVSDKPVMQTALGQLDTVHLFRDPPADDPEQKLDIWLAPSQNWYPVRIRYTDQNGDFIDQMIDRITPNPARG